MIIFYQIKLCEELKVPKQDNFLWQPKNWGFWFKLSIQSARWSIVLIKLEKRRINGNFVNECKWMKSVEIESKNSGTPELRWYRLLFHEMHIHAKFKHARKLPNIINILLNRWYNIKLYLNIEKFNIKSWIYYVPIKSAYYVYYISY